MEPSQPEDYQCATCSKQFKHRYSLRRHVRVVHEGIRPYRCDCGKAFATREQQIRHTNSKHILIRPYWCERGCARSFASYTAREYHHRTVHDGVKYACPFLGCGKQYCTKALLTQHLAKPHLPYVYLFPLIQWLI